MLNRSQYFKRQQARYLRDHWPRASLEKIGICLGPAAPNARYPYFFYSLASAVKKKDSKMLLKTSKVQCEYMC